MYVIITLSLFIIFNIITGVFNSIMDILAGPFRDSRLSKLNPYFWEVYGEGLSYLNKWHNRDIVKQVRSHWSIKLPFIGTTKITKPAAFTDGWHLMKLGWRIFDAIAIIPMILLYIHISHIFHWETQEILWGAIFGTSVSYLSEWLGFFLTNLILLKKSKTK